MDWFFGKNKNKNKKGSSSKAFERLKLEVSVSGDNHQKNKQMIDSIRLDIIKAVQKHIDVNPEKINCNLQNENLLEINVHLEEQNQGF